MAVVDARLRVHGVGGLRVDRRLGDADRDDRQHQRADDHDRREGRGDDPRGCGLAALWPGPGMVGAVPEQTTRTECSE